MIKDNKHIVSILESFQKYFDRKIDLQGLERNIYAFVSAIEGDVPQQTRDFLENMASEIELVRFTTNESKQNAGILALFNQLNQHIVRAS